MSTRANSKIMMLPHLSAVSLNLRDRHPLLLLDLLGPHPKSQLRLQPRMEAFCLPIYIQITIIRLEGILI